MTYQVNKNIMLIGISGFSRVGKDTLADIFVEEYGFSKKAFADPVYKSVDVIFNINSRSIEDKSAIIHPWNMSLREMLQTVGTEMGRHVLGEDIWIRRMHHEISHSTTPVIITDARFDNEANYVKDYGILIHLTRENAEQVRSHSSENGVTDIETLRDYHVQNDSTIDDLRDAVRSILYDENNIHKAGERA